MVNDEKQVTGDAGSMTVAEEKSENAAKMLPEAAQGRIAHQLREAYSQLLAEPMPDKFTNLLQQLAKSEQSR